MLGAGRSVIHSQAADRWLNPDPQRHLLFPRKHLGGTPHVELEGNMTRDTADARETSQQHHVSCVYPISSGRDKLSKCLLQQPQTVKRYGKPSRAVVMAYLFGEEPKVCLQQL